MSKDYYQILGVSKSASAEDVKAAFRKLAHVYHPDKKGGDETKFKEINEAYQVLGNAEKRQRYDQFGSAETNGFGGGYGGFSGMNINMDDFGDMFGGFGDIFGFGGGRGQKRSQRGSDLEMNFNIDFMEAVFGCEKDVNYSRQAPCNNCGGSGADSFSGFNTCTACNGRGKVTQVQRTILGSMQMEGLCPNCQGEGKIPQKKCSHCHGLGQLNNKENFKVKIPAGIDDGESIRLQGKGQAGPKGSVAGDLFLRIRVKDDKRFDRRGDNIYGKQEIDIKQAILGDKIDVETVDGVVKLTIPEGTQSATVFRLKERGVPRLHNRGRGDHFLEVTVKIPKGKKALKNLSL